LIGKVLGFTGLAMFVFACGGTSAREVFSDENQTAVNDGNGTIGGQPSGSIGSGTPEPPKQPEECTKMDIVFVVDNSGSMKEEQANLAANFPKFIAKIDTFKTKLGSKLDWRLAVTTTGRDVTYNVDLLGTKVPMTEKGENGVFRMPPECGTSKRWVEKADADATSKFTCLAKAGTSGAGIEMPLYTSRLALTDRMSDGTNAGFLRDDALLAFVILTDEDDCSREDNNFTTNGADMCSGPAMKMPADYKASFDSIAKGPGRWAAAVIAGQTSCTSSFGDAVEAKRLKEFVALAGKNGTFSSICDGDLTGALERALDTFDGACKALPPAVVK